LYIIYDYIYLYKKFFSGIKKITKSYERKKIIEYNAKKEEKKEEI